MKTAVFAGVRPQLQKTNLLVSLAVHLASQQLRTLLIDLSGAGSSAAELLGLPGKRNVLGLVEPWLQHDRIGPNELEQASERYQVPPKNGSPIQVDILYGDQSLSVEIADRLRGHRSAEFAGAMHDAAASAGYAVLLVDVGAFPVTGLGHEMLRRADGLFLVGEKPEQDMPEVLRQHSQLPRWLRPALRAAILRGSDSWLRRWSEIAAQEEIEAYFIPWVRVEASKHNRVVGTASFLALPDSDPFVRNVARLGQRLLALDKPAKD